MKAEVKDHLGAPAIFVDGQPLAPLFLYAEPNPAPTMPFNSQAKLATAAGLRLLSCSMGIHWSKPGEKPDFADIDRAMETILAANPGALVLIRSDCTPPAWWLDAHPAEEMRWADGKVDPGRRVASIASRPWMEELKPHYRAFVEYCEAKWGDHILGYHPCGMNTAEWFYERAWEPVHGGFDEPMRTGFAAWAKEKYGADLAALRAAWNQPAATFEAIGVPSVEERDHAARGFFRDPATERFVIDFATYQQESVAGAIAEVSHEIKAACGGRKLVAAFYGYYFELVNLPKGGSAGGHYALARLLRSPDVDIICSPISYQARGLGGISGLMPAVDSIRAAGKLYLLEDDTRTWLSHPDTPMGAISPTKNLHETVWEHRRSFGHLLPRRMATWYMDLVSEGWLNDPGIWDNIRELRGVYDEAMAQPCSFKPEVAVVVDERSIAALAAHPQLSSPLCSVFRMDFYRMGAPFALYLLSDVLEGRVELPKATLLLGCWRVSDAERAKLQKALAGRTAIWFYGSGYLGEREASTAHIAALTGFKLKEQTAGPARVEFKDDGSLLTARLGGAAYGSAEAQLTPRWSVEPTTGVTPLARFSDGSLAVAARSDPADTKSLAVYVGTTGCPAQLLRNILRQSGAHVWVDSDDVVEADSQFLSICAGVEGERSLRLPPGANGLTPLGADRPLLPAADGLIREPFAKGETKLYRVK